MQKTIHNAYSKVVIIRWVVTVLATLLAHILFKSLPVTLYAFIVMYLTHELPTLLMGIYLALIVRAKEKTRND